GGDGEPPAGRIGDFGAKQVIDARSLRRMPRLSQLALVAAHQAIAEASATTLGYAKERSGIVLGTGLGPLHETLDFMKGYLAGRRGGVAPWGGVRPCGRGRAGGVRGEGAAVLVLEGEADASAGGARVLARIAGAAWGGERRPRVGWGEGWQGAARVVGEALRA